MMEADIALLPAVAVVFAVAGAVKGVVGFGLPTIAMGLLGALITPAEAAAILVVPTLLTNIWQMWRGPHLPAVLRRLWPMMVGILIGTVATAGVITGADPRLTTTLLGVLLAVYAVLALSGRRLRLRPRAEPFAGPAAGLTTGFVNGATAIFVLPAVPYLQAIELGRDELIQAMGLSAFVSACALALGLGINRPPEPALALPIAVALITSFAGMAVGQALRGRLSLAAFQRWVFVGLAALGVAMVARALL